MTFTSTPGVTYQFVQTGISTNDFRVSIIATNLPLILEQPKSGTVAAGHSALLWILAAGDGPFGYQWRFNETDLPGENGRMLAMTNLNLKELRLAKNLWARTSKRASTDTPVPTDLMPYLPRHAVPDCPNAAYYIFQPVVIAPECSYPGHVLEEPS